MSADTRTDPPTPDRLRDALVPVVHEMYADGTLEPTATTTLSEIVDRIIAALPSAPDHLREALDRLDDELPGSLAEDHRIRRAIDEVVSAALSEATPSPETTLDDAWREAEAAIAPDRRMGSLRAAVAFDGRRTFVDGWTATAPDAIGIGRSDPVEGRGPTPAAALLALAARLRGPA